MKLAFLLSESQILKTYAQVFEEEWCNCNLRLKRRRFNKIKHCPFELENAVKRAIFSMEFISERALLKNHARQMKDWPFLEQNPFKF